MIRDVIGDAIPDHIVTKTVIDQQFNAEKSLDILLQQSSAHTQSKLPLYVVMTLNIHRVLNVSMVLLQFQVRKTRKIMTDIF